MKNGNDHQNGVTHSVQSLGFRVVVPMFALALLSMGNQSCEQPDTTRNLKMSVEVGALKGRVIKLPNGETIDFPYVANSLFYREVFNHDHFVMTNSVPSAMALVASKGVLKTQDAVASKKAEPSANGLVSSTDVAVLEQFGFLKNVRAEASAVLQGRKSMSDMVSGKSVAAAGSVLPACLYEMPQAILGGEIISFEATWGAGLGIGYNSGGDLSGGLGGSVKFSSSKLEIGLRTDDPLLQQVIAIGDGVSRQSTVNFGIDFSSGLPIGLDFFFKTPITDVIRAGMTDGLNQIVETYKKQRSANNNWNEVWESRVIYDPEIVNGDTHVAFLAGTRAGVKVGDMFQISNMHYKWEGAACYTRLKYSIPTTTTPLATGEVVSVGDNVAVVKVSYLLEQRILPGAQVKLLKFKEVAAKK